MNFRIAAFSKYQCRCVKLTDFVIFEKLQPFVIQVLYFSHQIDYPKQHSYIFSKFCQKFKIKIISSRPYNPKAKGNIERSHRVLRNKLHYNMVKLKNKDVNWVENVPNCMRVLNEFAKSF